MNPASALAWPVLAQIVWTMLVLALLGVRRYRAIKEKRARLPGLDLSREGWPDDVRKVSNNFDNQFQTPVLFYAICGVAVLTGAAGGAMAALAWLFVVTRIGHTAVHVTSNHVPLRFGFYAAGVGALVTMTGLTTFALVGQGG